MRVIAQKDHQTLCDELLRAFTLSPDLSEISSSDMLSRAEFGRKLSALTADGAPVMGTGRSGAPIHEPKPGQNLAAALQDVKAECGDEKLLVVWCASHRLDLVAKRTLT